MVMKMSPWISVTLLCGGLFGCASGSGENFFSTTSSGNIQMAVSEAIEYPKGDSADSEGRFEVKVMVANLYYGTTHDGSVSIVIGTKEDPGYSFESITVSLLAQESPVAIYPVNLEQYALPKNGILLENAKTAKSSDYSLSYPFDLDALLKEAFDDQIVFSVIYVESFSDATTSTFGRKFSFHLKKENGASSLSDFSCDYL